MRRFCCSILEHHARYECAEHGHSCPDQVVRRLDGTGVYVLPVRDGGSSYVEINFCPWCGSNFHPGPA